MSHILDIEGNIVNEDGNIVDEEENNFYKELEIIFTKEEMIHLLEISRIALRDNLSDIGEEMDVSSKELEKLYRRLKEYMN